MAKQLLDQLRERRDNARELADQILTRAAEEERDLTGEESTEHRDRVAEVRELDDEIEKHLEAQVAEIRAQSTREPEVQTRTLADVVLERGFDLKTRPSIEIPADELIETRASTLPAVASWARAPGIISPLGQDARFVYPRLVTQAAGETSSILDFRQASRTLTGTVKRNLDSVAAKATVDVSVSAVTEDLAQFAIIVPDVPNQVLESVPTMTAFLNSEASFQIGKAIDNHWLAQVVAAAPPFGQTGTTLVDKIRNGVATMRGTGANPTLAVLNPTDGASLDLTADAGGYVFASRDTGTASPIWGLDVVERIGGGTDALYLVDPQMLGVLYLGSMRFEADPFSGFNTNTTRLRIEVNALYHVRQAEGARRVAAA